LLTRHLTYREMAQQLGVSHSTIGEDVKVIRERWRERAGNDYADFLAEELAKLDQLEREVLPHALSSGPKGGVNLRAVDRVLTIMERRGRYLGLDSPSKVQFVLRIEMITRALEETIGELGPDPAVARPILGRKLRELDAAPS
jgi:hypothetical protein